MNHTLTAMTLSLSITTLLAWASQRKIQTFKPQHGLHISNNSKFFLSSFSFFFFFKLKQSCGATSKKSLVPIDFLKEMRDTRRSQLYFLSGDCCINLSKTVTFFHLKD